MCTLGWALSSVFFISFGVFTRMVVSSVDIELSRIMVMSLTPEFRELKRYLGSGGPGQLFPNRKA